VDHETNTASAGGETDTRTMVRDMLVLQFKLAVDGLRDFLLIPASLVAGIVSLARAKHGRPGSEFYRLIGWGKRTEEWIDLFGAHRNSPEALPGDESLRDMNIDQIVDQVESFIVDEEKRGSMTAQARDQIDRALDAIQRRRNRMP
jgi:hypothetical protein